MCARGECAQLGACVVRRDARGDENLDSVVGLRSGHIKITCDPPQKVVVDGEVLGNTPVQVDVVPGAAQEHGLGAPSGDPLPYIPCMAALLMLAG